jgi:hypothetical protein
MKFKDQEGGVRKEGGEGREEAERGRGILHITSIVDDDKFIRRLWRDFKVRMGGEFLYKLAEKLLVVTFGEIACIFER